ncbi:hypothetical protein BDF20DRAFT_830129 [Mycotypha africana]|uniref:uncharacterized protein n=1 Tax=Mycotypha africana TaxID=64632 RepID=UPI0023019B3D|nr:uncharacterized protein BDF20DRAFT_830129 [Mycotypha africana]KAI8967079.1 hypothetical protein BDF20DRAFT_830129 [Mycotypha africana]
MILNSPEDIVENAYNILIKESESIHAAAQRLKHDLQSKSGFEHAVYLVFKSLNAGGKLIITGVGKSGKIGEKIVATLLSTGSQAVFLHPVEALHGDLGIIQANDVVLALSFSGNTEELLMLVPSLKMHRNVPIIGLGGNQKSKLAKECDAWMDGYVEAEAAEEYIPAPTSSTTLALALGDALALTLAKLRGFTTGGFALNHPGGSLGRRFLLKVKDVMIDSSLVASVCPSASLDIVIMEMTKFPKGSSAHKTKPKSTAIATHLSSIYPSPPLSETSSVDENDDLRHQKTDNRNKKLIGIITHDDIHRVLKSYHSPEGGLFNIHASDVMLQPSPPITLDNEHLLASEVIAMMKSKNITLLPVLSKKNGICIGIVTLKDLQELF